MTYKLGSLEHENKDALKEVVELSILYDFYGELLSEHKKQIFEDYVLNNLSLGEISEAEGISRQGVHDIVKRCSKALYEYEEKLSLVKKFNTAKTKVNSIKELSLKLQSDYPGALEAQNIIDLATEIIDEF